MGQLSNTMKKQYLGIGLGLGFRLSCSMVLLVTVSCQVTQPVKTISSSGVSSSDAPSSESLSSQSNKVLPNLLNTAEAADSNLADSSISQPSLQVLHEFYQPERDIHSVGFSPSGQYFYLHYEYDSVLLSNSTNAQPRYQWEVDQSLAGAGFYVQNNTEYFWVVDQSGDIQAYQAENFDEHWSYQLDGSHSSKAVMTPDGQWVAYGNQLWHRETDSLDVFPRLQHATATHLSSRGDFLASHFRFNDWVVKKVSQPVEVLALNSPVEASDLSVSGRWFVTSHANEEVHLWNAHTFDRINTLHLDQVGHEVRFSQLEQMLMVTQMPGRQGHTLTAYSLPDLQPQLRLEKQQITSYVMIGDHTVVVGDQQGYVTFWSLTEQKPLYRFWVSQDVIEVMAYSEKTQQLLVGDNSGRVRLLVWKQ